MVEGVSPDGGDDEQNIVRIENEDDAWNVLQEVLENKIGADPNLKIVWSGWPNIRIYLPNVPEDATISTPMMSAILELQTSIYRTHVLLSTGTSSLRTLTQVEREQFEIRAKVEPGSSAITVNLNQIIEKYGNEIITKMSGTELLITVLGLALIYAGKVAYSEYLNSKTEQRKIASDDDKTKHLLDNFQSQLAHDTKRYEMLTRAIETRPALKQIEQSASTSKDEIIKAVADERGGEIQGISLSPEVANEISSVRRIQSSKAKVAGQYKVAKVDTTVADGFRVTLEDIKSGEIITASLFDAIISAEHRQIVQTAEWNKKPLYVEMSGRSLRGKIVDAKIVSVRVIEAQD